MPEVVTMRTVVVVGGGVIGLTTAYHLAREGASVVVLDARATGLGASAVNAGWFVPAEAMPVPGPGMVVRSLKWMLRADSPLYIRPSADPAFWSFMVRMWRRCNAADQRAGFEAHLRLAQDTARVLDEYRADGVDFEMHESGLLMAFLERGNLDHHVRSLDLVRAFGLEPQVLVGDDVRVHEPLLSDRVRGGIHYPLERHLDPRALAVGLHKRLLDLGVEIVESRPVTGVRHTGDHVTAVTTAQGDHSADAYVLAAGGWTGPVSRLFGHPLPVRPGKGYSVEVAPVGLRGATNLSDAKVALTPFSDRLRIAGTMEFGGLDEDVDQVRAGAVLRAPAAYLREWDVVAGAAGARAGIRPMTPDGLPVIGRLGRLDNAYVTSGHGMLGVTLAAGSAQAVTDLVLHGTTPAVLAPFDPARF
jgi:D-amino-acid dehydrogenase